MATTTLTTENVNDVIAQKGIVLIDFWASWCGPCRMFAPVFESASQRNPDIVFGTVDTEDQVELARAFEIRSIPTLIVVREGIVLYTQTGGLPETSLADLIAEVRELDMESVRATVARSS